MKHVKVHLIVAMFLILGLAGLAGCTSASAIPAKYTEAVAKASDSGGKVTGYLEGIEEVNKASSASEGDKKLIQTFVTKSKAEVTTWNKLLGNMTSYAAGLYKKLEWYWNNSLVKLAVVIWYSWWWVLVLIGTAVIIGVLQGVINPLTWGATIARVIGWFTLGIVPAVQRIVLKLRGLKQIVQYVDHKLPIDAKTTAVATPPTYKTGRPFVKSVVNVPDAKGMIALNQAILDTAEQLGAK